MSITGADATFVKYRKRSNRMYKLPSNPSSMKIILRFNMAWPTLSVVLGLKKTDLIFVTTRNPPNTDAFYLMIPICPKG